jgi:flagellin-specific chaperone FliS
MRVFNFHEFSDYASDSLLESIIHDATHEERIMMLFGILDNMLKNLYNLNFNEESSEPRECVHAAIDMVSFLKNSLTVHKDLSFNAAYKRFFTSIYRKIIDAYEKGTNEEFQTIRASVAKLTSPPFSKGFFSNLSREISTDDDEIIRYLVSHMTKTPYFRLVPPVQHKLN